MATKARRTSRLIVVAVVAVAALAVAAAYGFGGSSPRPLPTAGPHTVVVSRMTLVDYDEVLGRIGFGEVLPLRYLAPPTQPPDEAGGSDAPGEAGGAGTAGEASGSDAADEGASQASHQQPPEGLGLVTWLPPVGATVHRGEALLRVDERRVVLLYGSLPLYRALATGARGADVKQLERNLAALGYSGFTMDDRFTGATASAVRRWQRSIGVAPTGAVEPGQAIYASGAVRVAEHRIRIGDVAGGDILGYTGTVPRVTADLPTKPPLRVQVRAGTTVTVQLPDGPAIAGTIRRVMSASTAQSSAPQVEIATTDPAALSGREGAVRVRFVVAQRRDVLAVPVVALVALAEGGYGVEVADGDSRHYVPVSTGLFARGFVEITSPSGAVREGARVVVPA